ncbi:hypothetical protein POM88_024728 [Heracleum sosnowskyi]|uniref:Uncharacterized protein n=1 Tax=Heracleum sosnowskyi TaxID=360622 RepID=A0AAD8I3T5_9APIA|nr:hypothetical protein POM88_024728 [Heracleum sosnowskyi]
MLPYGVVYFLCVVKVADVVSILGSNNHNGFHVIDHTRSGKTLVIGLIPMRLQDSHIKDPKEISLEGQVSPKLAIRSTPQAQQPMRKQRRRHNYDDITVLRLCNDLCDAYKKDFISVKPYLTIVKEACSPRQYA